MARIAKADVYPESRFGGYSRVDGTVEFYSRVQALLGDQDVVLDIGCGRGKYADDSCRFRRGLTMFQGPQRSVIGIDVDDAGETNPTIDEFRKIEELDRWPLEDASINLAVANSVVEHVTDPAAFFHEAARVLKPGGYLCLRTYNTWSYVGVASRLIPSSYHARVLGRVQRGRNEHDVFPTVYRCNTRRKLRRAMETAGLDSFVYSIETEPGYLGFSSFTYVLGAYLHACTPPAFRWTLLGFAQKPTQ